MAVMQVNPTRMELTRLKKRYATAFRGHKLLKDKRDELMRQFLDIVRQNKELRDKAEASLSDVYKHFAAAKCIMPADDIEMSLMAPKQQIGLDMSLRNVMSVNIPVFEYTLKHEKDIYPYGYTNSSAYLDFSIEALSTALPLLLELAGSEKAAQLLALEIEKTRRRVNALEHVLIPRLQETIKYITMKLDENERGNLTRLMKIKDIMVKEQFATHET